MSAELMRLPVPRHVNKFDRMSLEWKNISVNMVLAVSGGKTAAIGQRRFRLNGTDGVRSIAQ